MDQDGQSLFVDRKKDLIKSGGENVASVKVEAVLLAHPAVASAGVVGAPHERWGEAVVAFVALKPNTSRTGRRADRPLPRAPRWLRDTESSPLLGRLAMTATGKVQQHDLRATHGESFARSAMS